MTSVVNGTDDDLHAALAIETSRREFLEARLARCQRRLTEAHETIRTLTQLVASTPGLTEVGVIAHAALLETFVSDDEPPRDLVAATAR